MCAPVHTRTDRRHTGKVNVSVLFSQDTFWLSQKRMSELFAVTVQDISYHLIQINDSGELQLSTAIKKILNPSDNCDEQAAVCLLEGRFYVASLKNQGKILPQGL